MDIKKLMFFFFMKHLKIYLLLMDIKLFKKFEISSYHYFKKN